MKTIKALLLLAAAVVLGSNAGCGAEPIAGPIPGTDGTAPSGDGGPPASPDGGGGGGDVGVPQVCGASPPSASASSLQLDGIDDHVAMGAALPQLGLAKLTLEAWVRRDGAGREAGTGVGGLPLVPIIAKGRGENDGSNVDCNYAFGFWGDVLGADFEDMASGLNHPVFGKTVVPRGEWHHVAATFDGAAWRLYLDGRLDGEAATTAVPRADSIQHFGIGATFDSKGTAAGSLHGAVSEVRVWDHARTSEQLASAMYVAIPQAAGLVGRWPLVEDQGLADTAGAHEGTLVGGTFIRSGVVLDAGLPPIVADPTPASPSEIPGTSVDLGLTIDDPDSTAFAIELYLRELNETDDFTVVVLPDTQYYTVEGKQLEHLFYEQTQWIRDNRKARNIVGVLHNGDVTNTAALPYQWTVATKAMKILEAPDAELPHGLAYGVSAGNHDHDTNAAGAKTTIFNGHFGPARFAGREYYHGSADGKTNDANLVSFSTGSELTLLAFNFKFYWEQPDAKALAWMRSNLQKHRASLGIVNSHWIIGSTAKFGTPGQGFYDAVKDLDNAQLMTCGHVGAEARRTDTFEGHAVHSMLADYQSRSNGGDGWLRIWEFSPATSSLNVSTYSPSLDKWETDDDSAFALPVNLAGAGRPFQRRAAAELHGHGAVEVTIPDLRPGATYEWYAVVSDCANTTKSPVYRFTTAP